MGLVSSAVRWRGWERNAAAVGRDIEASDRNYIGPHYYLLGIPSVTATGSAAWDGAAMGRMWNASVAKTGANFWFDAAPQPTQTQTQQPSQAPQS
jgi:hypothetical protein